MPFLGFRASCLPPFATALVGDDLPQDRKAALFAAIYDGKEAEVRELLDCGISANSRTVEGETALHQAAKYAHVNIAKALLCKGADIESRTPRGETPIYIASRHGHVDIIQLLCQHDAEVDSPSNENWSPLHAACYYCHPAAVKELLQKGANVSWRLQPEGWTPLHKVAIRGFIDVAKELLDYGADLNARARFGQTALGTGWTPLYMAARGGHLGVVELFLQQENPHAEVDAQNQLEWSPLHAATYYRRRDVVAMLAKARPSLLEMRIKDGGLTALHMASSRGYSEIVEELLDHGSAMEARTRKNNSTPLYVAAREGHVNILQMLVNRGAEIDVSIKGGWTPLHAASYYGRRAALRFLLRSGAPREVRMEDGWTALHKAAEAGFADIADVLLDYGAIIDSRNISRETPLHVATIYNQKEVVSLLLMRGANLEAKDKDAMPPLTIARAKNHKDCASVLDEFRLRPEHIWSQGDGQFLSSGRDTPAKWLEVLDHINKDITNKVKGSGDAIQHRVNVAILDTGCSIDGTWFSYSPEQRIRISDDHWHDFAGNESSPVDVDGHGTKVVSMLLRAARNAEIFVGRIAKKREDLSDSAQSVVDGIEYAVNHWDAHIISMSFGFRTDQPLIRNAISKAMRDKENKILFFAAAGNRGANEEELYPASSQYVVSARATDHMGTFVGDYNPPPAPKPMSEANVLYGTLGVNVPYDFPSDKVMSGCSIATPIMAGMTALIIQYAACHGASQESITYLRQKKGLLWFFEHQGVGQGNKRTYIHLETLRRQGSVKWVTGLDSRMIELKSFM